MNCKLYECVGNNKLYFKYVGPIKVVSFYEYYDSKEIFNEMVALKVSFRKNYFIWRKNNCIYLQKFA